MENSNDWLQPSSRRKPRSMGPNQQPQRQRWRSEARDKNKSRTPRFHSEETMSRQESRTPFQSMMASMNKPFVLQPPRGKVQQNAAKLVPGRFSMEVSCPFCGDEKKDKVDLVKHLDENCQKLQKKITAVIACKLQPNHTFLCKFCPYITTSLEDWLSHLRGEHQVAESEWAAGAKSFKQSLLCLCCNVQIPCNFIQIRFHMQHDIHRVKRESQFSPDYYLRSGIHSVYCLKDNSPRAVCLDCSYISKSDISDMLSHIRKAGHLKFKDTDESVYCSFCQELVPWVEGPSHFASATHIEKQNKLKLSNDYELCFYCGFSCGTLEMLFFHMTTNCGEINKIRTELGGELAMPEGDTGKGISANPLGLKNIDKKKSILVKANADMVEVFHLFKNFGKIKHVEMHDGENILFEFQKAAAVAQIKLIQSFAKIIGDKVDIKFFDTQEVSTQEQGRLTLIPLIPCTIGKENFPEKLRKL